MTLIFATLEHNISWRHHSAFTVYYAQVPVLLLVCCNEAQTCMYVLLSQTQTRQGYFWRKQRVFCGWSFKMTLVVPMKKETHVKRQYDCWLLLSNKKVKWLRPVKKKMTASVTLSKDELCRRTNLTASALRAFDKSWNVVHINSQTCGIHSGDSAIKLL